MPTAQEWKKVTGTKRKRRGKDEAADEVEGDPRAVPELIMPRLLTNIIVRKHMKTLMTFLDANRERLHPIIDKPGQGGNSGQARLLLLPTQDHLQRLTMDSKYQASDSIKGAIFGYNDLNKDVIEVFEQVVANVVKQVPYLEGRLCKHREIISTPPGAPPQTPHADSRQEHPFFNVVVPLQKKAGSTFVPVEWRGQENNEWSDIKYHQPEIPERGALGFNSTMPHFGPGNKRRNPRDMMFLSFALTDEAKLRGFTDAEVIWASDDDYSEDEEDSDDGDKVVLFVGGRDGE
jgi:hypothetical protein